MRRTLVKLVAAFLGVAIVFPSEKKERPAPKNMDYRLSRRVWYDGTVHWVIEQYISSYSTLKLLFPSHPTDKMTHIGGIPAPRDWIPLPKEFGSEEEAIEYLNNTLRSCEVMETSYVYLD